MRILVTGATGFIGQHVMLALQNTQHEIAAIARSVSFEGVTNIPGDLNQLEDLKEDIKAFNPEVILHLAWQGIPDLGPEFSAINQQKSLALIQFAKEIGVKQMIALGSCLEYANKEGECDESDALDMTTPFALAKNIIHSKLRQSGMNYAWLRIFYVYGPGQRAGSLLPYVLSNFTKGKVPQINTPENANDFIYVKDVVKAILKLIGKEDQAVYNVCSNETTKVKDICEIVGDHFNVDTFNWVNQESISSFYGSNKELSAAINWQAETSMKDGIEAYVNWFKKENI